MQVPIGHLDLAAWQADDGGPVVAADETAHNVVQESVHRLGQAPVPGEQVQQFVEEQQHGAIDLADEAVDGFRSRRGILGRRPERLHARVAGELAGDVDPRRFAARLRVPGVADEHCDLRRRDLGQPGFAQQVRHAGQPRRRRPGVGQVPQGGQHVRLAAAHLRDERLHRRGVIGLAGEATHH